MSEKFINIGTNLDLLCECGRTFKTSLAIFRNGKKQCNTCSLKNSKDKQKFSFDYIKKFVSEESNCRLLSTEYINVKTKMEFLCSCGNKFQTTFDRFKNKNKRYCNDCAKILISIKNTKHSINEFKKYGYHPISNSYEGFNTSIYLIDKDGYKVKSSLNCIIKDIKPYRFHPTNKFTEENIKLWLKLNNKPFKLIGKGSSRSDTKLTWECELGHRWDASRANITNNGTGCPICKLSRGEIKIANFLKINNIENVSQKTFCDLYGMKKGRLSYDFYLPKYKTLIEYQGEFHDGTARQQSKQDFEVQKEHDKRKREYAKNNNIKLLEIWYYDFDNIEEILEKELKNL